MSGAAERSTADALRRQLIDWLEATGAEWFPVEHEIPLPVGTVMIADVVMGEGVVRVFHDLLRDPRRAMVQCRLGELPVGSVVPTLLELLQSNLLLNLRGQAQVLGLGDEDDAVYLSDQLLLGDGGESAFRLKLFHLLEQASQWGGAG